MSSHGKRTRSKQHKSNNKKKTMAKDHRLNEEKTIKQASSSSDDEQTNYAEQIEQFKGGNDNDDDEAEIDKLILKHVEPVFSKPTFDMQADVVKSRKSKTLPMNRILKNNLDINEQSDDCTNINRQVKQYQDANVLTRNEHEEVDTDANMPHEANGECFRREANGECFRREANDLRPLEESNTKLTASDYNLHEQRELPYEHKTMANDDVIMVYPDYSGPYKINKKVFRICYISVVVIMLITLMFIIVLQHFRGYITSKQHVEVMESKQDSEPTVFAGGGNDEKITADDEQPIVNSLDNIISKHNVVIKPVGRMRDSKGRFIKMN